MSGVGFVQIFIIIFFMCVVAYVAIFINDAWYRRLDQVADRIKDELGLIHPLRNHMLVYRINHMIDGLPGARSGKAFGLKIGQQTIILGDYLHVRHEGNPNSFIHHSVIAIPLDLYEDVPPFALRSDEFFDDSLGEIGWLAVNKAGEQSKETLLSIVAPVKFHEALWLFFDARPELVRFCLRHNRYRLICDGRCIVFYRPYHVIELSVDDYAQQAALAKELFNCLNLPISHLPDEGDEAGSIKSLKDTE